MGFGNLGFGDLGNGIWPEFGIFKYDWMAGLAMDTSFLSSPCWMDNHGQIPNPMSLSGKYSCVTIKLSNREILTVNKNYEVGNQQSWLDCYWKRS